MSQAECRAAVLAGDVDLYRRISAELWPHLPQPANREQAEIAMHHARTQMESIPLKFRAWSHRWLTERMLPSGLPDRLKQPAERLYPRKAPGVMIGFRAEKTNPVLAPAYRDIREAMEGAVLEADAEGRLLDDAHVRARMSEARRMAEKALFG